MGGGGGRRGQKRLLADAKGHPRITPALEHQREEYGGVRGWHPTARQERRKEGKAGSPWRPETGMLGTLGSWALLEWKGGWGRRAGRDWLGGVELLPHRVGTTWTVNENEWLCHPCITRVPPPFLTTNSKAPSPNLLTQTQQERRPCDNQQTRELRDQIWKSSGSPRYC